MLTDKILAGVPLKLFPDALYSINAEDICADSRQLKENTAILFFAYKGSSYDNHEDAAELYRQGKIMGIVAERALDGITAIIAEDGRKAFSLACGNFFGNPDRKMTTIGVTGTNGKTTVTYLLESIFNAAGKKTVRIGTIGADIAGTFRELNNTTPSAYDFYSMLAEGYDKGAEVGIAEVSSHALEQGRLYGATFDTAVFTNISGDHLDYHRDMESYYAAKKLLFTDMYSAKRIVNTGTVFGKRLYAEAGKNCISYGIETGDVHAADVRICFKGILAKMVYDGGTVGIDSSLVGDYNLENVLAAVATALALGVDRPAIEEGVKALENIPGRLEKYVNKGITAFVDYAHTDDALANVLSVLKKLTRGHIVTLVGAGGDRDKTKRPRMGKIAQLCSDKVVVTSDNPRMEDPDLIIEDILAGMERNDRVYVEPDREKAIALGVRLCGEGDVLLVAGKGHEDYQIIGAKKYPFSDSKFVQHYLGEL